MKKAITDPAELAADEDYVSWVLSPNDQNEKLWSQRLAASKTLLNIEAEARQIVMTLSRPSAPPISNKETELMLSNIHQKLHAPTDRPRFFRRWISTAATLLLLAAAFFLLKDEEELATKFGETHYTTLSDGTGVYLNANSEIKIVGDWKNEEERIVQLSGEAFFDVTSAISQGGKPFIVQTDYGRIIVKGTEFNLESRINDFNVVLTEGYIDFQPTEADQLIALTPGQKLSVGAHTEQYQLTDVVNTDVYTSWRSGQLICASTPLREITDRITDTYGISVLIEDASLTDRKISGTLENNNLDELLAALKIVLDINVVIQPDKIILTR